MTILYRFAVMLVVVVYFSGGSAKEQRTWNQLVHVKCSIRLGFNGHLFTLILGNASNYFTNFAAFSACSATSDWQILSERNVWLKLGYAAFNGMVKFTSESQISAYGWPTMEWHSSIHLSPWPWKRCRAVVGWNWCMICWQCQGMPDHIP